MNNEITEWAINQLLYFGYTLKNHVPEKVLQTAWSHVARFLTTDGYIYLKVTPNLLSLEAIITLTLRDKFYASVPEVIAHNENLHCFLMRDAGVPLRQLLKKQFDASLLCNAIDQFISTQLIVAEHVDLFLDLGVPDWRLNKLPNLFEELLSQKDLLSANGLSGDEIKKLESLLPKFIMLCDELSGYNIKQSIVQCDYHDNNILIDVKTGKLTHIDLGEIVISHPFFSLITCLRQIKKHHGLSEKDSPYKQVENACTQNYFAFESKERLLKAFEIAKILWVVYEALGQYRLMVACGVEKIIKFQPDKLGNALREFVLLIEGKS